MSGEGVLGEMVFAVSGVTKYFYCPNPNCRRKLFFGVIESLIGYLNYRCPRCHAECTLGVNSARQQVLVSSSPQRPAREAVLDGFHSF